MWTAFTAMPPSISLSSLKPSDKSIITCECWSWCSLRKRQPVESAKKPTSCCSCCQAFTRPRSPPSSEGTSVASSILRRLSVIGNIPHSTSSNATNVEGGTCNALPTRTQQLVQENRLPCGLFASQVSELLDRDITPNDYEMLLLLDEALSRPTADRASLEESLRPASAQEFLGEKCSICLHEFDERNEEISALPCGHAFHQECITRWLLESCKFCPLCGQLGVVKS